MENVSNLENYVNYEIGRKIGEREGYFNLVNSLASTFLHGLNPAIKVDLNEEQINLFLPLTNEFTQSIKSQLVNLNYNQKLSLYEYAGLCLCGFSLATITDTSEFIAQTNLRFKIFNEYNSPNQIIHASKAYPNLYAQLIDTMDPQARRFTLFVGCKRAYIEDTNYIFN